MNIATEKARAEAKRIMEKMKEREEIDDPRAEEALEYAIGVVRAESVDGSNAEAMFGVKDRLAAARLVLDFTKTKPVKRVDAVVQTAEAYLDELAEEDENGDGQGETAPGAAEA